MLFVLVIIAVLFNPHQSFALQPKYDGTKTYLTIWFDHAFQSQTPGVNQMLKDGIKGAFLVRTGVVGGPQYMNWTQLHYLSSQGFEMADHSRTHPQISDYTSGVKLTQEILASRTVLLDHNFRITGYVSPYDFVTSDSAHIINNHYQWTVIPYNRQNTVTSITHDGKKYGFTIPVLQHMGVGNPPGPPIHDFASAKAAIDYAIQHHTWLILSYHQLDDKGSAYHTDPALFLKILAYVKLKVDAHQLVTVVPSEGLGIH